MYNEKIYLTPQDILNKEFKKDTMGYRPQEVDKYLDMVIRDLSWAYIEQYLSEGVFFTSLFQIYRDGYFPCAWEDTYPDGKAVVIQYNLILKHG